MPKKEYSNMDRKELIKRLNMFAEHLGKTPSYQDFIDYSGKLDYLPAPSVYIKEFGSYIKACEEAGLETNKPFPTESLDSQKMLKKLKGFAEDIMLIPTVVDVDRHPYLPHSATYKKKFGTWENALEEAGVYDIEGISGRMYSKERLLHFIECKMFEKNVLVPSVNQAESLIQDFSFIGNYAKPLQSVFHSVEEIYEGLGITIVQYRYWFLVKKIVDSEFNLKKYLENFNMIQNWINSRLEILEEKEKEVVRLYYIEGETLERIAFLSKFKFGTRERTRQLREIGINKLNKYKEELLDIIELEVEEGVNQKDFREVINRKRA